MILELAEVNSTRGRSWLAGTCSRYLKSDALTTTSAAIHHGSRPVQCAYQSEGHEDADATRGARLASVDCGHADFRWQRRAAKRHPTARRRHSPAPNELRRCRHHSESKPESSRRMDARGVFRSAQRTATPPPRLSQRARRTRCSRGQRADSCAAPRRVGCVRQGWSLARRAPTPSSRPPQVGRHRRRCVVEQRRARDPTDRRGGRKMSWRSTAPGVNRSRS